MSFCYATTKKKATSVRERRVYFFCYGADTMAGNNLRADVLDDDFWNNVFGRRLVDGRISELDHIPYHMLTHDEFSEYVEDERTGVMPMGLGPMNYTLDAYLQGAPWGTQVVPNEPLLPWQVESLRKNIIGEYRNEIKRLEVRGNPETQQRDRERVRNVATNFFILRDQYAGYAREAEAQILRLTRELRECKGE